jgi:D-galactose 1-dehydrogenase
LLRERILRQARIRWMEDARQWHPGQIWLREMGGFGVFDAGINALSILTRVVRDPLFARSARLYVPANWKTPIAAELELESAAGASISATLDFRHPGTPAWEIDFSTDQGSVRLAHGGAALSVDGGTLTHPRAALESEYAAIYRRFEELIRQGQSEADARPLQCVADLFLVSQHIAVDSYTN